MPPIDPLQNLTQFTPAGPVAQAFLQDTTSKIRFLRGPIGGGKTVSCVFDVPMQASRMPLCRDGQIHVRGTVIGTTYGQLERNLYPSWKFWLPPGGPHSVWEGGGGRFAQHFLKFDIVRDGVRRRVNLEMIFAAIGEQSIEQFVRGYEPTFWWLFEVDMLPEGIVEDAIGRLGRFPNSTMRLPDLPPEDYRSYVVGDLNAPDIDSWYYRLVEEVRPPGLKQYVQPSGLSPHAENIPNLAPTYYQDLLQINGHRKKWVTRFIRNEYGPTEVGEPVYPEYSDAIHLAPEPLRYDPNRKIDIGLDQGLTQPAAVVTQRGSSGQWRVILEYVPGRMNARRFAQGLIGELAEHCPKCTIDDIYADPAGFSGADQEVGELAWAETVGAELKHPVMPAPSNEIDPRLTAVKDELSHMLDGGTPSIVISRNCKMLRKGFASHYVFQTRAPEKAQFGKPLKNTYANPHDALQYLLLGKKGRYGVIHGEHGAALAGAGTHIVNNTYLSEGW